MLNRIVENSNGRVYDQNNLKYDGDKGIDHAMEWTNPADGQTYTVIIDTKQMQANGSVKLNKNSAKELQMSDPWLDTTARNIGKRNGGQISSDMQSILDARDNGTLLRWVAAVDKSTGTMQFINVDIPNKP